MGKMYHNFRYRWVRHPLYVFIEIMYFTYIMLVHLRTVIPQLATLDLVVLLPERETTIKRR